MAKLITFDEFDGVFGAVDSIDKYPSEKELKEKGIPFSEQLSDLAHSKQYEGHNTHVKEVVVTANRMLSEKPSVLVKGLDAEDTLGERIDTLFLQLPVWANHFKLDSPHIIRAAAVYHDIGKWIVKQRHPTEGYYLLKYLFPPEEKKFQHMVGSDAFQLLVSVIRDHDKFGIVSTGEASLNVMVDFLNPAKTEVEFYEMAIVALMLTNFCDIAVSVKGGISRLQAEWIVSDVDRILHAIREGAGKRLDISRILLKMDSEASNVTHRIARLVDASCKNARQEQQRLSKDENADEDYKEDQWAAVPFDRIASIVSDKLQVHFLGSAYQQFCTDFAHYCKFDYALYFFGEVARQLNLKRIDDDDAGDYPIEDFVGVVVDVIKSVVATYRELVKEPDTFPRRIGIQMQSLLRPGVKETITQFLAGTKGPGSRDNANVVSWITNEVSAWLFI